MEIKEAKADLKKRQEAVAKEINQNATLQQQLQARMKELVRIAEHQNGEADMLNRLSDNGNKDKGK